jgi:hypothetical protein
MLPYHLLFRSPRADAPRGHALNAAAPVQPLGWSPGPNGDFGRDHDARDRHLRERSVDQWALCSLEFYGAATPELYN